PERPELDLAEPERQVGQGRRLRRRRDRDEGGAVGRDLGEREGAERKEPGGADEHLQSEYEDEVDEELLDEEVACGSSGGRVGERAPDEGDEEDRGGQGAAAQRRRENLHTRSAVRTVNSPWGR